MVSSAKKYDDPQQELRMAGFDIQVEAAKIADDYVNS